MGFFSRLFSFRKAFQPSIKVEADGFVFWSDREMFRFVLWEEILEIVAFKRDLFTVDQICFSLRLPGGEWLELDEEMVGWSRLTDRLAKELPGFDALWFFKVAFPAFEPCVTRIYRKVLVEDPSDSSSLPY